jgi:hypothetical protein
VDSSRTVISTGVKIWFWHQLLLCVPAKSRKNLWCSADEGDEAVETTWCRSTCDCSWGTAAGTGCTAGSPRLWPPPALRTPGTPPAPCACTPHVPPPRNSHHITISRPSSEEEEEGEIEQRKKGIRLAWTYWSWSMWGTLVMLTSRRCPPVPASRRHQPRRDHHEVSFAWAAPRRTSELEMDALPLPLPSLSPARYTSRHRQPPRRRRHVHFSSGPRGSGFSSGPTGRRKS